MEKTHIVMIAVLAIAFLFVSGLLTFSVINWEWNEIARLDQLAKGGTFDFAGMVTTYNNRIVAENKQVKDISLYTSLKPKITEIEKITYDNGDTYLQVHLSDGYVLSHKYGVSGAGADYKNDLAVHFGSVFGCQETAIGKPSTSTSYQICTDVRGIDVYIKKTQLAAIAMECTDGEIRTETCYDGSKVTLATCDAGSWKSTYKVCQRAPPSVNSTQPPAIQCTGSDKMTYSCQGGTEITLANCVSNRWSYTQQECPEVVPDEGTGLGSTDEGDTSSSQTEETIFGFTKEEALVGGIASAVVLALGAYAIWGRK